MATKLTGIDIAPAETWNWLKTNEASLLVPDAPAADPAAEVPAAARRVLTGAGAEATQWLDASATARKTVVVGAGAPERVLVKIDSAAGSVAQTSVFVRPGAEATVDVVVADGLGAEAPEEDSREHAAENEATAAKSTVAAAAAARAEAPITSGHVLRIHAEAGAHVHVNLLVATTGAEQYLDALGILADARAEVVVKQYIIGAATTTLGTNVDLHGERSRLDLALRYLAGKDENLDLGYSVPVYGAKARANLDMTGVLSDNAKKALRATIDLCHGCKGAKGAEQETVLVAGDDVINKTLPVILCDEDDVEGSHGAAIGSVSPEQLAYLADRGLTEEEAQALFTRAIIEDAAMSMCPEAADAIVSWAEGALGKDSAAEIADAVELARTESEA